MRRYEEVNGPEGSGDHPPDRLASILGGDVGGQRDAVAPGLEDGFGEQVFPAGAPADSGSEVAELHGDGPADPRRGSHDDSGSPGEVE